MSPILGTAMLPPHAPSDPYDVPASSPLKALNKRESVSRAGSKALTPARDSDRDVDGNNDASVTASTEPEKEDRNGTKEDAKDTKEDKVDAPTPKEDEQESKKAEPSAPADIDNVEIDKFVNHRVNEDIATVDIQVKWVNGERTWESEWSLQNQVPSLIYQYWDELNGRDAATGLDVYHVFRILKRAPPPKSKKNTLMYQVQWVGYRPGESTWEHESKIKEIAPDELIKYEAKNGSALEAQAPKRGVARAPGRPKKKVKTSDE